MQGQESTREKVRELADAVKKLKEESERLRNNLDRMHQLQTTLYQTDTKLVEWLEAGNKIEEIASALPYLKEVRT